MSTLDRLKLVLFLSWQADDFLEDILNLEAGLEAADRNRVMDTSSHHQTLPPEVIINKMIALFGFSRPVRNGYVTGKL